MSANLNNRTFDNPFAYAQGQAGGFGSDVTWTDPSDGTVYVFDPAVNDYPDNYPEDDDLPGSAPVYSGGGGAPGQTAQQSPPWWALLGPSLINVAHDALTPVQVGVAQAGASRPVYYPTQQYPGGQYPTNTGTIGSIGFDAQGIRLGDGSHISWLLIVGGVVVFALVQSRGFQRR